MARIAGVDLPRDKRIEIGLTYIYGIDHNCRVEGDLRRDIAFDIKRLMKSVATAAFVTARVFQ